MVKPAGVVLRQQVELVGDGEDHVKVIRGQKFLLPARQPAFTRLGLTLRAVPVATRVVGNRLKSASWAGIEVTTERRRAAVLNGSQGFELLGIKARSVPVAQAP